MLHILLGISGSGKSTYIKKNAKNDLVICPDEERRKLGSISDQSHNKEVFDKCYAKINTSKDVWFDATNLNTKSLEKIISTTKDENIEIIIMKDSYNKELCKKRIKSDIENKIERSNVPEAVSDRQYDSFINIIKILDPCIKQWKEKYNKTITVKEE